MRLDNSVGEDSVAEAVGRFGKHVMRLYVHIYELYPLRRRIKRQASQRKAVPYHRGRKINFHTVKKFDVLHVYLPFLINTAVP